MQQGGHGDSDGEPVHTGWLRKASLRRWHLSWNLHEEKQPDLRYSKCKTLKLRHQPPKAS